MAICQVEFLPDEVSVMVEEGVKSGQEYIKWIDAAEKKAQADAEAQGAVFKPFKAEEMAKDITYYEDPSKMKVRVIMARAIARGLRGHNLFGRVNEAHVRLEDGGFLAISRKCTHLGCTVPWVEEDKRFACPCHGSTFDITGNVIQAPAPRALDLFPVTIENNVVKVNTGKRIKRSAFRASQVTYPR